MSRNDYVIVEELLKIRSFTVLSDEKDKVDTEGKNFSRLGKEARCYKSLCGMRGWNKESFTIPGHDVEEEMLQEFLSRNVENKVEDYVTGTFMLIARLNEDVVTVVSWIVKIKAWRRRELKDQAVL